MQLNGITTVLFDFDGVLIDSEPLHFTAWQNALAPLGVRLELNYFLKRFVGIEDRQAIQELAAEQKPPRVFDELWSCFSKKQKEYIEMMLDEPLMMAITVKLIEELKFAGFTIGVVSPSSGSGSLLGSQRRAYLLEPVLAQLLIDDPVAREVRLLRERGH